MRIGSSGTGIVRVAVLLLLLGVAGPVLAAPGSYHEDERVGYKIKTPKGWSQAAQSADEQWIILKYLSDKEDIYIDDVDKYTWTHKPDMTVIAFIETVVEKTGPEVTEEGEDTVVIEFNNPYKNYKDFLQRTYRQGGWYVSAEEEDEVDGVPVTQYEIKVEKLTMSGPKRIVTWVYHMDDVDLAVQFIVLENAYDDHKRDIRACLKSFKKIARTKGSLTPAVTGGPRKYVNEEKLSKKEREEHRKREEERLHQKNIKSLPDDWKVKEMGPFLVLLHGDEKYAKDVVKQAEAIWKWLDKEFGFVGKGEYVKRPIIRICKDGDEERAFLSGTAWGSGIEIVTHKDPGSGSLSWEFEYVNKRMYSIWFNHRARDLYWAMPHWIDNGLYKVIGTAKPKGRKLEFKVDDWERKGLQECARNETLTAPKTLVMLGREEFYENRQRTNQSAAFVRFLLESKSKKTRSILHDYLKNLQDILDEQKAAEEGKEKAAYDAPETEEEEEERFRKRREAMKEREAEFLREAFQRTFGEWDDKDWKKVQKQYYKSL